MKLSFRSKLLASHAIVAVVVGIPSLLVIERAVSSRMEAQIDRRLEAQAVAVAQWIREAGRAGRHPNRLASRLAEVVAARVMIIDQNGIAKGDSTDKLHVEGREAVALTPEVVAARKGRIGRATRQSADEGQLVRYIAAPAPNGAVVRLSLPIGVIDDAKEDIRRQLIAGVAASLLVALALAFILARALTRRLSAAQKLARRIGAGDYTELTADDTADEVSLLSNTLVAAAGELKKVESRRREFLANVAHEIRTPVTSIRGFAETLQQTNLDAATVGEFVSTIHRNSVRIGKLVEDLLELEAIEAGKSQSLAREPVPLRPIAEAVARTLQARVDRPIETVTIDIDDQLSCTGDPDAIERIILNLVENALRYGGKTVTVQVTARVSGERVAVSVRDDGPGISAVQRGRVFERFFRGAAASQDRSGSGLGLAISRELAQAMDGTLSLVEDDQPGTTFTLSLPA